MNGKIFYRFTANQIELDGFWSMSSEPNKERFAYLFKKPADKIDFYIDKNEVKSSHLSSREDSKKMFQLHISTCNIHELLLINNSRLYTQILNFISSDYHGYFIYFSKTIEDSFYITFEQTNGQTKISGKGTNNLGSFSLVGYAKFYSTKGKKLKIKLNIYRRAHGKQ